MPVVDVHHHFLPDAVFQRLKSEAGGAKRLVNDRISITLNEDLHDPDAHLRAMDVAGVDAAILTFSGVALLGTDVCRMLNDGFAQLQRESPGRLFGAAHVSLADPEAPRELERAVRDLGLVAAALPTSELGINLDAPQLIPLWETISRLDLAVILHPALLPPGATTDYHLERSCARPFDTTIAAARIAYTVVPRVPNLRVVLPHVGGTTIFLRGRIAMFYEPPEQAGRQLAITRREQQAQGVLPKFEEAWSHFLYDTAGTGGWAPAVQMAVDVVGADKLLFGSDFPLESYSGETMRELVEMVQGLPLSEGARQGILGNQAAALFRLPEVASARR